MPAKKTILSDEDRAKNIREAARKIGASNDPKVLERVLKKIAPPKAARPTRKASTDPQSLVGRG